MIGLIQEFFAKAERRDEVSFPFKTLRTDFHSHFLPGIDDGAEKVSDSIDMLKGMRHFGLTNIIASPHVKSGRFPNTIDSINTAAKKLRTALKEKRLDIKFSVSGEYHLDEGFREILENNEILPFCKKKLLVEFSFKEEYSHLEQDIFSIRLKRLQPILAHPERYLYFAKALKRLERYRHLGCEFQMNILSLAGYYGIEVERFAFKILSEGLVDYLGTDMHNIEQMLAIREFTNSKIFKSIMTNYQFKNHLLK